MWSKLFTSRRHIVLGILLHCIYLGASAQVTSVPYDPAPFTVAGYITAATVDDITDLLSGGTLTVNGVTLIVPRNLLVNTPSLTAVAWSEFFTDAGVINLPLWPEVNWEASIFSNFVGGRHIAGLVYIYQETLNINQGFITHIDYDLGEFRVGGSFTDPNTGVRVVINDPVGRFGKVHGEWPLWTADTDNPSVSASTGFPVCLPRVDPAVGDDALCPKRNRPLDGTGKPLSAFTFQKPPVAANRPDPNFFAPLAVGDHIIYSGTIVADGADRVIAAYAIDANLGIYTTPGAKPAYVKIEVLQAGIDGDPAGEIAETRVEGYTTDQTSTINIFAVDVDPCSGVKSERAWGNAIPRADGRKGQWRFRSSDAALSPYTREVVVRMSGQTVTTPNGIIAGQFVSPYDSEGFVFPELNVFGDDQIPFEFDLLPFLASGSGPWLGGIPGIAPTLTGPIVGQLDPWPGVNPPSPPECPVVDPTVPVSDAGVDITIRSGTAVKLSGTSRTINLPIETLSFLWEQTDGLPLVNITNGTAAIASFIAPVVTQAVTLVFKLTVSNAAGNSTDTMSVVVSPTAVEDFVSIVSATWKSGKGSGVLTVIATTSVTDGLSHLSLSGTNPTIASTSMTVVSPGRFQGAVSVKTLPASVAVTSNLGGFAQIIPVKG